MALGLYIHFFNAICYAICHQKTEKLDQCNDFQDEIGTELYENY